MQLLRSSCCRLVRLPSVAVRTKCLGGNAFVILFDYSRIMESTDAAAGFAALAQETRLNLMRLLAARGASGMSAGEIADGTASAAVDTVLSSRGARAGRADPVDATRPAADLCRALLRPALAVQLPHRDLLRRAPGALRRPRAALARRPAGGRTHDRCVQCPVPVHAQFRPLADGARRSSRRSAGASSTPTRRAPHPARGPMPEVIDKLQDARPRRLRPALQVVERVHRPRRAAHGFRDHALRHAAGPGLPRCRRQAGHRRLAAARSGQVQGHAGRARHHAQRALRHDPPAARDLRQPAASPRSTASRSRSASTSWATASGRRS